SETYTLSLHDALPICYGKPREAVSARPLQPLDLIMGVACARGPTKESDMAKKITGYIKLQVPAGAANPSPPIGPALGQRGVNIMEFCKAFNAQTGDMEKGTPLPTVITVYADRSFSFETKTPPATYLIKKAAN